MADTEGAFGERRLRTRGERAWALRAADPVVALRALFDHADCMDELLRERVDDEPCRLDHHGYCQNHYLDEGECWNRRARRALEMEQIDG